MIINKPFLCHYSRFETEARGNSELIAYLICTWHIPVALTTCIYMEKHGNLTNERWIQSLKSPFQKKVMSSEVFPALPKQRKFSAPFGLITSAMARLPLERKRKI